MLLRNKKIKQATVDDTMQIVTFHAGDGEYGIDIHSVTEAIRPLKVTPLPRMPQFVEGVINLRGAIIPIVDLRKRFGIPASGADPRTFRMLITRGAVDSGELIGLIVDSVQEVITLFRKEIEPAPDAATGEHARFISGVAKIEGRLVILIDILRILSREERAALAEVGDVHA